MKKIFILIAIASMTFCACNKSEIIENKEAASFVASFDANTKTTLNNDKELSQSWLGGEVVKVLDVTHASQITDPKKEEVKTCTFTNIGTKGPKATFVADNQSFEFVGGHNYFVYYGGTSDKSDQLSIVDKMHLGLKFSAAYLYNPTGKYGLSDNLIPLVSKFKYTGKASVQNIMFHNISSLLVLRVTNTSGEDKQVGYIRIGHLEQPEQPEKPKPSWRTHIFGGALPRYSKIDDYSDPSTSYNFGGGSHATNLATVSFSSPITIKNNETKDFAVCVVQPYSDESFDLTAQIYNIQSGTIVASAVKSGLSKTKLNGPGHTYVWSIDITSSKATNVLNINPLGNNELAF